MGFREIEGKYLVDLLVSIPEQLFKMVMMCGFHKRFPGIIIPRNLCSFTRAIEVLFMKVFNSEELICLRRGWKMMNLNLSG